MIARVLTIIIFAEYDVFCRSIRSVRPCSHSSILFIAGFGFLLYCNTVANKRDPAKNHDAVVGTGPKLSELLDFIDGYH